ncbi:MAG: FAD-dependent thymidylate synthase [Oscillospiraceae bacterium]|nr:FAD-dependent thymidylate synthase [Oscillospiraceae bacterium]
MKVYLLTHTEDPERIVAAAAKLCYSDSNAGDLMEGLTDEETHEFIDMLINRLGHESPIEHASFTFAIEGVSRSLLAQITRHRHTSFSVQSQRYVRLDDFKYVIPPAVAEDEAALQAYKDMMESDAKTYELITSILKNKYEQENIDAGLKPGAAASRAEKRAIEDARFVFPNACETKLMMTMNARSLHNFFKQRCCSRAQWEIREVADEMLRLVYPKAPAIFARCGPGCVRGPCPEGEMSCKNTQKVREFYRELKEGVSPG